MSRLVVSLIVTSVVVTGSLNGQAGPVLEPARELPAST